MEGLVTGTPVILLGLIAVVGVAMVAVLTASEAAISRLTRAHVAELKQEGRPNADACSTILDRRHESLLGINFARALSEITTAVAVTLLVADILPSWWSVLLVAIALVGILEGLLMGSPRELGRRNPAATAHALATLIRLLGWMAQPFGWRRRRAELEDEGRELAAEELRDMVDLVSESEHMEEVEREMLFSVFELRSTLTREVMVPRPHMITVNGGTSLDKALALFVRSGYSRVPVIGENVDDVLGVLYLKDSLRASRRPRATEMLVDEVMRPARLVPEMKPVDELMREMQAESFHIAVVIDEYGGVAGLVTMEDLIEELVGEVQDEHDANPPEIKEISPGTFRVPARLPIDELGDLFELDLSDDDVDTAGGLLAKALGRVPIEGSEADALGLHLLADKAGGRRRRIITLVVSRSVEPEVEE